MNKYDQHGYLLGRTEGCKEYDSPSARSNSAALYPDGKPARLGARPRPGVAWASVRGVP